MVSMLDLLTDLKSIDLWQAAGFTYREINSFSAEEQ